MKIKIIVFAFLTILISCKKETKPNVANSKKAETIYNITQGKHCFKEIIENKIEKDGTTFIESNELVINLLLDGSTVSGNFDYLPYKEKLNNGNFTGVIKNNIAKTICVFNQNGKVKKEEVIFKIDKYDVSILGGEKEEIDGVWKFKDPSKDFYMNKLPRVKCN